MGSPRVRLGLAAALFLGWISWLGYLAATTSKPVILSRPQFLVSALDVRARIDAGSDGLPLSAVAVAETLYPPGAAHDRLTVTNFSICQGWEGPGEYLLALIPNADGTSFQVAPTPPSPGILVAARRPRIYPFRDSVRWQLRQIAKPGQP